MPQDQAPDHQSRRFNIEGRELAYPTYFRNGTTSMGMFTVNAAVANELIKASGFTVAKVAPGKAILSLSCVHYIDTDCGSYEEIALSFFVNKVGKQQKTSIPYLSNWYDIARGTVASYTWCLPVSSTLARDCGIFMWGFPKTIAALRYENTDGKATMRWLDNDHLVLEYTVAATGTRDAATLSPPVYSIFEDKPHVSYLSQTNRQTSHTFSGGQLELGDHPIAEQLRRLGLPKKPLLAGWAGHLNFEMSHPQAL